ncbi:MAG TPA: MurR/RpiR family transcriptional regulator [Candidatus Binatia bacterium]
MDRDLNNRIYALRRRLSPQLDRVAGYVLHNGVRACFLNTRALADAAGVSAPTVVRFVRLLGYKSYPSFRGHLQQSAHEELGAGRAPAAADKPRKGRGLVEQVVEEEASAIRDSLKWVREEDCEAAIGRICRADSVYLLAGKTSFASAYMLYYRLSKLGIDCKLIHPGGLTVFGELAPIGGKDALLVIGFQRIPSDVLLAVREAKRKKAAIIAITDPPASPISVLADVALYVDRGPREEIRSATPCVALCTALVIGVAARKGRRSARISAEVDALENSDAMYLSDGRAARAARKRA